MSRKIVYLINPISGSGGKTSLRELIDRRTREKGIEYQILPTNADGNYSMLIPLIEKEGVTDVVVCGGDGTVRVVAAELRGRGVRIGIIPMGSGNGLAFTARIPKQPDKALDVIFAGHASLIDGFTINGNFSCMLCGIGLDGKVAHDFARQRTRGLKTYIRVTAVNFFKAVAYPFRIDLPASYERAVADEGGPHAPIGSSEQGSRSLSVDAFFINIANANQFGNNFTIAPRASLSDGLLDIVVARKKGKLRVLIAVFRQVLGRNRLQEVGADISESVLPDSRRTILYFQTSALTIANPQGALLNLDGDPGPGAKEFEIRVVPGAINLIQPK